MQDEEITVAQAAKILGVSPTWVNRAITRKVLIPTNIIPSVLQRPAAWKLKISDVEKLRDAPSKRVSRAS